MGLRKITTYFKRVKETPESKEEARLLEKETKTYFFVCLGAFILFMVLGLIPVVGTIFGILAFIFAVFAVVFGFYFYSIKSAMSQTLKKIEKNEKKKKEDERLAGMSEEERAAENKRKEDEKKQKAIREAEEKKNGIIEGLKKVANYRGFQFEEKFDKEFENDQYKELGYRRILETHDNVYHTGKTPRYYFEEFIETLEYVDHLRYVGPSELLRIDLEALIRDFETNDDGEIEKKEPCLSVEDCLDASKNPVLNFAVNFNCFKLPDDENGTFKDKFNLYEAAEHFVLLSIMALEKNTVTEDNPWLFEKDTYLNDFGMPRSVKNFYIKAIEKTANDEYKGILEHLVERAK